MKRTLQTLTMTAVALIVVSLAGCPQNAFFGLEAASQDEDGPKITFINPVDGQAVSGILIITGTTKDKYEVDKVEIQIDGGRKTKLSGTYNWYYTVNTASLSPGAHDVSVIATDEFGNSSSSERTFVVDQEVPSVNPDMSGDFWNYTGGTNVTIEGSASDDTGVSDVFISFDGGVTFLGADLSANGTAWSYTIADTASLRSGDGQVTVTLRAVDRSGLIGTTSYTLWIDNTPPDLLVTEPTNDSTIDSSADLSADQLVVSGTVDDNLNAGIQSVDISLRDPEASGAIIDSTRITAPPDVDQQGFSYPFDLVALGIRNTGPVTIEVTVTDRVGNSTSALLTVSLDDDPPTFTDVLTTGKGTLDDDLSLAANNYNTASTVQTTVDPGAGATVASVTARLLDTAGNEIVDYGSVDSGTATSVSHEFDLSSQSDGDYVIEVRVTNDRGGFAKETRTVRWDTAQPVITMITPTSGSKVAGIVEVSGTIDRTGSDLATIHIRANDGNTDTSTYETDASFSSPFGGLDYWDGSLFRWSWDTSGFPTSPPDHTLEITATDLAGNTGTTGDLQIEKDPDAPTVTFGTYDHPTNGDYTGRNLEPNRFINGAGIIRGDANDNTEVSAVEVEIDNSGTWNAATLGSGTTSRTWEFDLSTLATPLENGTHSISVRVTDDGGTENTTSITLEVDNDDPTIGTPNLTLDDDSGTAYYHGIVDVTGSSYDAIAGIESLEVEVDEQTGDGPEALAVSGTTSYEAQWDTEALPTNVGTPVVAQLNVKVESIATDAAGNRATSSPSGQVDVRPYISGLGKDYAYLGETGLTITGENFVAGSTVTVGGGSVTVAATGAGTIDIDIPNNWPNPGDLSSGPVLVTTNGVDNGTEDAPSMDLFYLDENVASADAYPSVLYDGAEVRAAFAASAGGGTKSVEYLGAGTIDDTDNPAYGGNAPFVYVSLAHDAFGNSYGGHRAYFLYSRGPLYAARYDDATPTLDFRGRELAAAGSYNDIAVDSAGNVHVAFYDGAVLKYMRSTDGFDTVPTAVTLDDSADVGPWVAIAVDSDDGVHVVYQDVTNDRLKYLAYDPVSTVTTGPRVVDARSAGNYGNDITIDASDAIHISYYEGLNGDLRYATAASAQDSFSITTVDTQLITGMFSSIAVDSIGAPHITYADFTKTAAKYARYTGEGDSGFETTYIADPALFNINANSTQTSTIEDGDGNIRMYYTADDGNLHYGVYLPED